MEALIPVVSLTGLIAACVVLGLKVVEDHERGLVTRFGRHFTIFEPGLNFPVPFVDQCNESICVTSP